MAGLALAHGINANQLRKWVKLRQDREATEKAAVMPKGAPSAFVPVVEAAPMARLPAPSARLPAARVRVKAQGRQQITLARSKGMTPLEYMLVIMNDPHEDPTRRDRAAQAAAPYVHARLAPKTPDPAEAQPSEAKAAADWDELLN